MHKLLTGFTVTFYFCIITKLSSITTLLFYLSKNRSIEGKTLLLTIASTDAVFSQQSNSYIIILGEVNVLGLQPRANAVG